MKEQILSATLPELPIVGTLKLLTRDGSTLYRIDVVPRRQKSRLSPFFYDCFHQFDCYLRGKSQHLTIRTDITCLSPFQQNVMKVMANIPYGETASYKEIAKELKTKAYQAVGSACGRNPLMLIYPCHRVVGTNDLGGFAHGLKIKKQLLQLEGYLS